MLCQVHSATKAWWELWKILIYKPAVDLHRCSSHKRVLMHRGQRCWDVCNSQASPLLHALQWTTHLVDAVQFGQTRCLFLLPSGWPCHRGGAGSETGSAWTVGSSTGVTSNGGCIACGSSAGVGAGTDSVAGVVVGHTSGGTVGGLSRVWSMGKEKSNCCSLSKMWGAKSDSGIRPNNSWRSNTVQCWRPSILRECQG